MYPANEPPLKPGAYRRLPLGSIRPEGWLRDQLLTQKRGLTGHLDQFWLTNSVWKGGDSEETRDQLRGVAWSRAGKFMVKYLAGLMPLAHVLDDQELKQRSDVYLNWILDSGRPDGWFGQDREFPGWNRHHLVEMNSLVLLILIEYYDVSQDKRIIPLMTNYFRYLHETYESFPQQEHWGVRIGEHIVSAIWLYNRTKDPMLLELLEKLRTKSFNWSLFFTHFPWRDHRKTPADFRWAGHTAQVYNNARAIKYPSLWYLRTGDTFYRDAFYAALRNLDRFHGQLGGRFSGDEHLAGKSPVQGTELCAIALYMYSLEKSIEVFGDPVLADRLEMLAYNCLPATITPDFWAHQYDQQSNQVLVSIDERNWTSNRASANIYGLMPNYPCCLAGMHQAWPRLVQHLWMATPDGGLAAIAHAPCRVTAKVADGTEVSIREETEYPFDGELQFQISTPKPVTFPVYVRVPTWAAGAKLTVGAVARAVSAGSMAKIERQWSNGDVFALQIPLKVATETRYNRSVSIRRGPLYFALRIGKRYQRVSLDNEPNTMSIEYKGAVDWEIHPTTAWNYGLMIDREAPQRSVSVRKRPLTGYPFADRGDMIYDHGKNAYEAWQFDAPLVMSIKGKRIPAWTMKNNSADVPPQSPVRSAETVEELTLVPYGCTRLRIAEFPRIQTGASSVSSPR